MPLCCAPTEVPWTEFRSPHFELVTDAGERFSPGLLLHLENLRERQGLEPSQLHPGGHPSFPIQWTPSRRRDSA